MDPRHALRAAFPTRWPMASLSDDLAFFELSPEDQRLALPTLLLALAAWHAHERPTCPDGYDSVAFELCPQGDDDDLRTMRWDSLKHLTRPQRAALATFAAVHLPEAADAWARAADASDATWFEAWWPDRARPPADAVCTLLSEAFADVTAPPDAPPSWRDADARGVLLWDVAPRHFGYWLAAACWAVRAPTDDAIDEVDRALRPDLRPGRRASVEARWAAFTPAQRRAVAAWTQAYSRRVSVRRSWQHAAAAPNDDWLRHVQMEPAPPPRG